MQKWKKIALAIAAIALATGTTAAIALRGPLQALFPARHGLHQIASNVWSDDPSADAKNLMILSYAHDQIADFYRELNSDPRIVLCSKTPCANLFFNNGGRTGPRRKTWGASLVVVGPRGLKRMIVTHELAHAELHNLMIFSDNWKPRFPSWFDEGLASWISQDDRLVSPDPTSLALVLESRSVWDFNTVISSIGWEKAYGAALDDVARVALSKGKDGLLTLIDNVVRGSGFWQERARLLGPLALENNEILCLRRGV